MSDNKRKKSKKAAIIAIISLAIITVTLFLLNVCFAFYSPNEHVNFYTAVAGWVGFLATAGVGVFTLWQNKVFKEESEKKNNLIKEENDKIRRQDLEIRTYPKAVFIGINKMFLSFSPTRISNKETYNFLTEKSFNDFETFYRSLYIDLLFSVNDNVDSIFVQSFTLGQLSQDFWPEYSAVFKNYSSQRRAALKIVTDDKVNSMVTLLWQTDNECEFINNGQYDIDHRFFERIVKEGTIWQVTLKYSIQNNLSKVTKTYKTQFVFKIKQNHNINADSFDFIDGDIELSFELLNEKTITWLMLDDESDENKDNTNGEE